MSKKTPFVSFKAVKQSVSMAQVLDHYGLAKTLVLKGKDSLTGSCPIHHGTNPTQFRVSLAKNIWNCFGPCTGGNVLDFVAQMEKIDIREAALRLVEWFGPPAEGCPQGGSIVPSKPPEAVEELPEQPSPVPTSHAGVGVMAREESPQAPEPSAITANVPLPFALKNLDPEHESLDRLGISRETAEYFGAGYCRKGMMKDRLAIPIHNPKGELLAYAGRAVDPGGLSGAELYKYPPSFRRDLEVYNLNRAFWSDQIEAEGVIIVPDFLDVFALYQAGYDNAVALMGTELSEAQALLLARTLGKRVKLTLLLPQDLPGVVEMLVRLAGSFHVRLVRTQGNPATLPTDRLQELL